LCDARLAEFAEAFRILWEAQLANKAREVDKALEGLGTQSEALADAGQPNLSRK